MPHPAIPLAELIRRSSNLSAAEAERLALAWSTEIRLELEQTGISVIRGVGTLTLAAGVVRFQQDPDFPINTELPAVEGYSEAVAASLKAASTVSRPAPSRPPVEAPASSADPGPSADPEPPLDADAASDAPPAWEDLETMGPGHSDASAHETAATDAADTTDATEPDALPGDPWESDQSNADSAHGEDEEDEPWAEVTRDEPAVSLEDGAAEGADHALPADGSPAWSEGIEAAISRADAQFEAEAIPEEGSEVGPSDPVAPATTRTSRSARAYEDRHSSSSRLLVGIAAIVILVVAAALLYRFVLVPEVSDSPVVMADDSSATEGNGMPEAELDSSAVTTATPEEPTGSQGADAEDGPSANPSDPVRPTADPAATEALPTVTAGMGGYTLVVGSTLNAASAERVRGRFTDLGLPTGVLAVTADSTTRYRIAVGHFATAAGADSLRILKASELPEGTWVLSVR